MKNSDCFSITSSYNYSLCISENIAYTLTRSFPTYAVAFDLNAKRYIARKLTPKEEARLQGFPDWWCDNLENENPTKEEINQWKEIFETYRRVTGSSSKPKSENQIIKWLKNPYSDSEAWKMWGNGVALPCVCFILSQIKNLKGR